MPSLFAGIEQTEGRVCSGHGRCGATGCACEAGWKGHACEEPICLHDCAMHGACIAPGLCKCAPGWSGEACDYPVCPMGGVMNRALGDQRSRRSTVQP